MLKLRLLTIVAVFALVAAACGDSGSSSDDTSASGDTTAPTSGDTAPPPTSGDTAPPATSGNTVPATIGNIPGLSDDCEAIANVFLSFSSAILGGGDLGVNLDAIGDLPGDIQSDAAVMIDALQAYVDGVQELGVDFSDPASFASLTEDQQQALNDLSDSIDTDEFNAASESLSDYAEAECSEFVPSG